MNELGKILVIIGAVLVVVGLVLWAGFGKSWLGKLPGDISVQRESFSFYFPIVTCVLISVVLSLLLWLFRK